MLYLYIQKGKDYMKTSEFQKYLGGTDPCIKRLVISTEGCGQLTLNETYFHDSWSSSVKTAEEKIATGVNYCIQVKTSHKVFCLATSEKLMKYYPGGTYLVMKINPRLPVGRTLMTIVYT